MDCVWITIMTKMVQIFNNDLMVQSLFLKLFYNNLRSQWLIHNLMTYRFNVPIL